jgi:hypothetical protein
MQSAKDQSSSLSPQKCMAVDMGLKGAIGLWLDKKITIQSTA